MPYIRTAILGTPGAKALPSIDCINHFNMIRVRVIGSGVLRPTLYSINDVTSLAIGTMNMEATTQYVKEVKFNFQAQRMSMKLETTDIDEIFRITKITFFFKPLWASMPG